jgi:transcriptional regulator with XRE-family HTH domain
MTNAWQDQVEALGEFLRSQRKLANLSLRELAARTDLSNAYLSQIERGMHEPSVRVLRSISQALNVSANTVLAQAGILDDGPAARPTEEAIQADPVLSTEQKQALLAVYRSYVMQQQQEQQKEQQDGDATPSV